MKKLIILGILTVIIVLAYLATPMFVKAEGLSDNMVWESRIELQEWLWSDNTSDGKYIPTLHDCEDFAIELAIAAYREGKFIGLLETQYTNGTKHITNFAIVKNDNHFRGVEQIRIEPQNDLISFLDYLD